jgi:hypothetical protein
METNLFLGEVICRHGETKPKVHTVFGETKISELDVAITCYQQIVRFQVTMYDATRMQVLQRKYDLGHVYASHLFACQRKPCKECQWRVNRVTMRTAEAQVKREREVSQSKTDTPTHHSNLITTTTTTTTTTYNKDESIEHVDTEKQSPQQRKTY